MLIVLASAGHLGAFLTEDAELFCVTDVLDNHYGKQCLRRENLPGLKMACHSPSVFCTG